jgi:hypothetical protein
MQCSYRIGAWQEEQFMCKRGRIKQAAFLLIGGVVLAGVMGQGCPPVFPDSGGGDPVTVELINLTANPVDAFFWSDPGTLFTPEEVAIDINFIDVGGSLLPGDVVTITLDCFDAGTFLVDGDLLVNLAAVPSANLILVREGEHFFCGDIVSFYYELDEFGTFFISADVNDVNIAP